MYLTQSLHRSVQQNPERPATIYCDRVQTSRQSVDRISRLAGALAELGVTRGDRIAMLSLNSDRYHEYIFACAWIGAAVNPVNIRWSTAEIAYSLQDSDSRLLFVDDAFASAIPGLRELCPNLTTVIYSGDGELPIGAHSYESLVEEATPAEDVRAGGDELAGVFYTGGTTGHPKGVMLSHNNLLGSALGALATGNFITSGAQLLHAAPMFHLAAIGSWVGGCLAGATHVIVPMFTPDAVLDAISEHKITDMLIVPTMIQMLVDSPRAAQCNLSSMRKMMYGASPITEALLHRAQKLLPSADFTQGYGMTEMSPVISLLTPEDHQNPALHRSAGRAAPNVEVRIVDSDGAEVPPGHMGEIVARGDNVMLGYWNLPQQTAETVRDGWMHTGDGGWMDDDGYIYIVDRIKDMIITGGENVYSAEVENALASHPAVAACAVIGVPDADWGERVHAVVVLLPGQTATAEDVRAHCKLRIAGYKAPRTVDFVDSLPLSGAGKVLKRELRKEYWDGAGSQVS